jgi:hypothetical protein
LGEKLLRQGVEPQITYTSPDGEMIFYLSGGLAPFMGVTEGVVLAEGMDGLHAPFNHLANKGARQDGDTWTDTVYDPAEMTMKVTCTAQTAEGLRRVIRKWFASWDPKKPGTLSWTTPEMGQWTCTPRFAKAPPEKLERAYGYRHQQSFTWNIRNDGAFWRGPNSISQLGVEFESATDDFNRDGEGSLGPNWSQTYTGPGAGVCTASNGSAIWSAADPVTFLTGTQSVVCGPFKDYATAGDIQTISFIPANTPGFTVGTGAANYLWGRMGRNPDGSWNGYGVRAAVGWGFTQIAVFNNFVETVLVQQFSAVPPLQGETWTFHCGKDSDPNFYSLVRQDSLGPFTADFVMCSAHDTGGVAAVGANYRGVGFGLQAGGSILLQATPAKVANVSCNGTTLDSFGTEWSPGLGPSWPLRYSGSGHGFVMAHNGCAVWSDTALGRTVNNRWLGASEVQTIALGNSPSTWTLTFKGTAAAGVSQTTASLPGTATAAAVQSALEALPGINVGDVAVAGGSGSYTVTFAGQYAVTPMAKMGATVVSGGSTAFITVAQTTPGAYEFTATDYQVVSVNLGRPFSFPFPHAAFINVWGRWNTNDASPTGVMMQIGPQWVALFNVVAGVKTQVAFEVLPVAPMWNEKWTLVCGTSASVNQYKIQRDGATILSWTDKAGVTNHGPSYRGSGFGMVAGDGLLVQDIPPSVTKWSMGDNSGLTVSGHLTLTNFGDQDAYPDYLVYGPGTFTFADGPGEQPTVEFGPLTDGQIALLRTDPGIRGVYDLSTSAAAETLQGYSAYVQQLGSLAVNDNIQPLLSWFQSEFGVAPDQGNLYAQLQGRFSQPIPAMTLADTPTTHQIAVNITGASAATQVIAVITPQRRWPE